MTALTRIVRRASAPGPRPIGLPTAALLPSRPLAVGWLVLSGAAVAAAVARPAKLPPAAQRTADVLSVIQLVVHPVEVALLGRRLQPHTLTRNLRARLAVTTFLFGELSTRPALKAIAKAAAATR